MVAKRRIAVMMDLDKVYERHIVTYRGIQQYAQQADWRLIINDWADRMLPARADQRSPYDGLIGRMTTLGASRAKRLGVPAVNVWFNSPSRKSLPGVFPDYHEAGRQRAEHLLSRGFKNMGIISHSDCEGIRIEADAFEQAAREARCRQLLRVDLTTGDKTSRMGIGDLDLTDHAQWKKAFGLIDRWMDDWQLPIGLFIFNPTTTQLVIERCADRGWRVPEDVAIVSGESDEAVCNNSLPTLTAVKLPNERIGYEAARMLDELIDAKENGSASRQATNDGVSKPQTIFLPPVGIVARQSTDFFAVDDPMVRKALGYIDQHLHRPIQIEDIAEYAGVSRATLTARFREKLNKTVAGELQRLRIERVKRELVSTDKPIDAIAQAVGYSHARGMKAAFRKLVGCTPAAYRKRAQ